MYKMRQILLGFVLGSVLTAGLVWAQAFGNPGVPPMDYYNQQNQDASEQQRHQELLEELRKLRQPC